MIGQTFSISINDNEYFTNYYTDALMTMLKEEFNIYDDDGLVVALDALQNVNNLDVSNYDFKADGCYGEYVYYFIVLDCMEYQVILVWE